MRQALRRFWYFSLVLFFLPTAASADVFNDAKGALSTFSSKSGIDPTTNPTKLAGNIISTAIGILGVISVILIVYAGGIWLTAAGNEEKVTEAKKIIKTTVVGIVILALAYAITTAVIALVAAPSA